jgi:single-strand DNA-binding protein
MNKLILMGRLTRDPDVRYNNDNKIARYTLAVDRRFKKEGQPEADFFNCTVFGKGAEFAEKYLKQGTKIVVSGRIESDNYTNKDGQKVYSWQVIVDEQEFAESKAAQESNASAPKAEKPKYVDISADVMEDLPFM